MSPRGVSTPHFRERRKVPGPDVSAMPRAFSRAARRICLYSAINSSSLAPQDEIMASSSFAAACMAATKLPHADFRGFHIAFGYDGFGNLISQTVTKGNAPSLSLGVDPATNRITSECYSYDANGNLTATPMLSMTYNVANRESWCRDNEIFCYHSNIDLDLRYRSMQSRPGLRRREDRSFHHPVPDHRGQ